MKLSGHTTPFAVFGHPIGHTLSPVMHNASIQALGMDAIYLAFDVHPDKLMSVLPVAADMGFRGINLTVPLKEVAFNGIDDLAESAKRLGAVNTVEFVDGSNLRGHNTDGDGFMIAIDEAFGCSVSGKSVFVLGSGGAGRAVAITCACEGASSVTISDLDAKRAERVAEEIAALAPDVPVKVCLSDNEQLVHLAADSEIVIQSTPVGMKKDDKSLLDERAFHDGQMLFDLVYMYPETQMMSIARQASAKVANGLGMLLHQGARAFTIWTGDLPAVEVMRTALEGEVYKLPLG